MSLNNIKALCFDTGGTILYWHTGIRRALAATGARHSLSRNWTEIANDFRRRSLKRYCHVNLGRAVGCWSGWCCTGYAAYRTHVSCRQTSKASERIAR